MVRHYLTISIGDQGWPATDMTGQIDQLTFIKNWSDNFLTGHEISYQL